MNLCPLFLDVHTIHHHHEVYTFFLFLESYYFLLGSLCTVNVHMIKVMLAKCFPSRNKDMEIKCPLHSWSSLLCEKWLWKYWKKSMLHATVLCKWFPLWKTDRLTVWFSLFWWSSVPMKLIVRHKRPLLFENRIAKIFVHNQWSKYLRRPSKTNHFILRSGHL